MVAKKVVVMEWCLGVSLAMKSGKLMVSKMVSDTVGGTELEWAER